MRGLYVLYGGILSFSRVIFNPPLHLTLTFKQLRLMLNCIHVHTAPPYKKASRSVKDTRHSPRQYGISAPRGTGTYYLPFTDSMTYLLPAVQVRVIYRLPENPPVRDLSRPAGALYACFASNTQQCHAGPDVRLLLSPGCPWYDRPVRRPDRGSRCCPGRRCRQRRPSGCRSGQPRQQWPSCQQGCWRRP